MRIFNLPGRDPITDDSDCLVIAELGHNHQGDLGKAMEMIRVAKECGAAAVKFQKRDNRTLFTRALYDAPYDHENSFGKTYGEHREALEFSREQYSDLIEYAKQVGILLFATAFDIPSADFLQSLGVPLFKVASGDLKNIQLIDHVSRFEKPVIISTGGGNLGDILRAYEAADAHAENVALLQCTANYPCEVSDLNLRVIETLRETFPRATVGLSAHDNGIAMSLVAYCLGARVIEKHFTLDHSWKGTDHAFSLEPTGLRKLVRDLRRARAAMGTTAKKPLECEKKALTKMGKALYAAKPLKAGTYLSPCDIAVKSPGGPVPPYFRKTFEGAFLRRDKKEEEPFEMDDISA